MKSNNYYIEKDKKYKWYTIEIPSMHGPWYPPTKIEVYLECN